MKKTLLIIANLLTLMVMGGNLTNNDNKGTMNANSTVKVTVPVNAQDSVVFNLSQAVISGSFIDFPVSILSDDTVYALDFALKYNQANFTYNTIINLTNYLQPVFYYNSVDSTIRFTSYSLQKMSNDTPLVYLRFSMIGVQNIYTSDVNSVEGYLNGDQCSVKLVGLTSSVSEANQVGVSTFYPNPAEEIINIEVMKDAKMQIIDVKGKSVSEEIICMANETKTINIAHLTKGIYILKFSSDQFVVTRKLVIRD